MAVIETWLRQDLKGLVSVRSLQGQVFSLDNGGNLIGVKVTKDGQPVELEGTVIGYCILSDGQTVNVTGSGNAGIQNGNEAYIVLPQLVYSVPGQISIVIKLTSGNTTTTLAACTGYVYKSRTSNEVVPPGTPIPDLATMEEVIRRATAATDAANAATVGAEKVDASMTKEGDVITIAVTDRDGNVTEKTVTDQSEAMKRKANIDGYYEELAAGTADQLVSTEAVTDTTPYLYRKSGGNVDIGNRETLEKIVGGTVAWNQLVTFAQNSYVSYDVTYVCNADGSISVSGTATGASYINVGSTMHGISGHKILIRGCASGGSDTGYYLRDGYTAGKKDVGNGIIINKENDNLVPQIVVVNGVTVTNAVFKPQFFDLTAMFGPTIADYIYNLEQTTAGAGVAWFRKLFPKDYYPHNPGELISVKTTSHDMVGFNQWDEEWEAYGSKQIKSKNRIKLISGATYYAKTSPVGVTLYFKEREADSASIGQVSVINGTFVVPSNAHYAMLYTGVGYGTTYNHDICINLSHSGSRNGEYEPYEKHSYPLDSDLVLRGMPMLDANGNLYFDGDEYTPDGNVKRKKKEFSFDGSETWRKDAVANGYDRYYYEDNDIERRSNYVGTIINSRGYEIATTYAFSSAQSDVAISAYTSASNPGKNWLYIGFKESVGMSTLEAFKQWLSNNPLTVLVPLATPTIEQVAPYTSVQVVDDWGTEEFVDSREVAIPVGHSTSYMANLRDKLQHLPSLADEDGEYIVKQTGTKMELAKFSSAGAASAIVETTESLPIVSVNDGADGQPMRKVEVAIEPVQDLHGYEYPWPAGGGINQFGNYTILNAYIASDGKITSNSDNRSYIIPIKPSKTYAFKVIRTTASGSTANDDFQIGEYYSDSRPVIGETGARLYAGGYVNNVVTGTITTSENAKWLAVKIGKVTVTDADATAQAVQIEVGSTVSETYSPYSNVCPISGWTGAKVTRTGKNLLDPSTCALKKFVKRDGTIGNSDNWSASDFIPVKGGQAYTISGVINVGSVAHHAFYDSSKTFKKSVLASNNATFTVPGDASFVRLSMNTETPDTIQLELGSTASEFVPFEEIYSVQIPLGQTVYGGTLDVASGKLVVDRVSYTESGSSNINASQANRFYITKADVIQINSLNQLTEKSVSCDRMASTSWAGLGNANWACAPCWGKGIAFAADSITTANDWKAYFTENPTQFSYKLAQGIELTLSLTEIKTLLGVNNVWSDAGNTSITYPADTKTYIDNRINASRRLIAGIETEFKASKAYSVGDMLIIGDDLYKVASSIASGATITVGTNVTKTTVAEQLIALMNA